MKKLTTLSLFTAIACGPEYTPDNYNLPDVDPSRDVETVSVETIEQAFSHSATAARHSGAVMSLNTNLQVKRVFSQVRVYDVVSDLADDTCNKTGIGSTTRVFRDGSGEWKTSIELGVAQGTDCVVPGGGVFANKTMRLFATCSNVDWNGNSKSCDWISSGAPGFALAAAYPDQVAGQPLMGEPAFRIQTAYNAGGFSDSVYTLYIRRTPMEAETDIGKFYADSGLNAISATSFLAYAEFTSSTTSVHNSLGSGVQPTSTSCPAAAAIFITPQYQALGGVVRSMFNPAAGDFWTSQNSISDGWRQFFDAASFTFCFGGPGN